MPKVFGDSRGKVGPFLARDGKGGSDFEEGALGQRRGVTPVTGPVLCVLLPSSSVWSFSLISKIAPRSLSLLSAMPEQSGKELGRSPHLRPSLPGGGSVPQARVGMGAH